MKKGEDYTGITVVFFCHDGKGNVLLGKRNENCRDEHGCWEPGSGGVEFGDTVEETLHKEVAEEYETDIIEYEFLGHRDIFRKHKEKDTHWLALDFKVRIDPDNVKNGEPHKFDAVKWFPVDALPTPLHSQFPDFLEWYRDRL